MNKSPRNRRLLVLDDDKTVNYTISSVADHAGFETRSATAFSEFQAVLEDWRPTHVIIDLHMPDIDGVEALHQLADKGTEANIIVTSGLGARVLEAAARAALENGLNVVGTLPKPFLAGRLRSLLQIEPRHSGNGGSVAAADSGIFQVTQNALSEALETRRFLVHYQPKISCANKEVIGFEGLVRWLHPEFGIVAPDRFIPLAEECGLISELTRQVSEQALLWFSESFRNTDLHIALNISARVLADPRVPEWIDGQCRYYAVPPQQVVLEITETSSMQNPVLMLEMLTQFRIKGFSLSIDDFGVGYSSLVQLARLPFSEVKIDKMFVSSASHSQESQQIATAVVRLAHALRLHTVAEGVEDEWTLNFLGDIGCEAAQGYFIARPMSGENAVAWFENFPFTR